MLPNLSSLRLGPTRRVQALPPNGKPVGMYATDSDDEEEAEEQADAQMEEEPEPEEIPPRPLPEGYAGAVQYYEALQSDNFDSHAEQAYQSLRGIRYGMYVAENQTYGDAVDGLYQDLQNFKVHYDQASIGLQLHLGVMLRMLAFDTPEIKEEAMRVIPTLFVDVIVGDSEG